MVRVCEAPEDREAPEVREALEAPEVREAPEVVAVDVGGRGRGLAADLADSVVDYA